MQDSKVKDYMTTEIAYATTCMTLQEASQRMKKWECGFLPVGSKEKIVGVITDRDIVIRAVSLGRDVSRELVGEYMTSPAISCSENDMLEDAMGKMHSHKINRLVVKDKTGKVSGVLSLGEYLSKFAQADDINHIIRHTLTQIVA